jgi:hypothetical protein
MDNVQNCESYEYIITCSSFVTFYGLVSVYCLNSEATSAAVNLLGIRTFRMIPPVAIGPSQCLFLHTLETRELTLLLLARMGFRTSISVFERSTAIGLLITQQCALDHLGTGISKSTYLYLLIRPHVSWEECVNSIGFYYNCA